MQLNSMLTLGCDNLNPQLRSCLRRPTSPREANEDDKSNDQCQLPTEDVAHFCPYDEET